MGHDSHCRIFKEDKLCLATGCLWIPRHASTNSQKSGINYIASQKLSQNKINKFNNYLFRWQGLDGSEILMHNFPEDTYDSRARARSLEYIEQNYNEKKSVPMRLWCMVSVMAALAALAPVRNI